MLSRTLLLILLSATVPGAVFAQDESPAGDEPPAVEAAPETGAAAEPVPAANQRPLARAMAAMRDGNWAEARIVARGDGPVAQDVILWHYLRAGRGDPDLLTDFLARNGDWPGLPYLREKGEATISVGTTQQVLDYFTDHAPQTPVGILTYARAISDRPQEVRDMVREAWLTMSLSSEERQAFLAEHGPLLAGLDAQRLDMALWRGWTRNAAAMLPVVSEDLQKLAEARMALQDLAGDVDVKIEAVPETLADDAGLAHDRFEWRMRKDRTEDAVALLLERSTSAEALGRPEAWADRRRSLARQYMRAGKPDVAYQIASRHFTTEGSDFADLEWLSGFLALRFLNRTDAAIAHFEAFSAAVDSPISLGRAGYWLGRAYEAAGRPDEAALAYGTGAQFQTSFYGLLAAERGGYPIDLSLAGNDPVPTWREAPFMASSVLHAAILLMAAGETNLAERFFTHLAETLDEDQVAQLGAMLDELEQPHMQVMVGKRAAQFGVEVPGPYYALHPVKDIDHPVPAEIVLAIARRESEFDPTVISGVGARGLMQVMPGTAKEVAGWLDLPYSETRLLNDWRYNATLGAAYLASLSERFDGNVVMMAAGYNAGPGRPIQWARQYGDPRKGEIDIVDWIELIPFNETRNYVMRVAESLPVYRARLGKPVHPVPFSQELTGSTLLARAPEGE